MFDNPAVHQFLFGTALGLFVIVIVGSVAIWIAESASRR